MKTPLSFLSTLLVVLAVVLPVKAQDQPSATNVALATELVGIMHPEFCAPSNRIKKMESQIASMTNSSPEAKSMMQSAMNASSSSYAYLDKMRESYVSLYASKFTTEELQGVLAFYKTPIGQKWGEKQTEITMEFASKSMAMMPGIMDAAKKAMSVFTNLPATPSPAPISTPVK